MNGDPERYFREVVMTYDGDECLIWPYGKNAAGYGVWTGGTGSNIVSRHVCEEAHGPAPTPKHEAAHSCGRGSEACVTKRHVSWKTRTQNERDKVAHCTSNRGERQWRAKLTEAQVLEIRSLRGAQPQRTIAKQFGVVQQQVSRIQSGKDWWWLSDEGRAS